MLYIQTGHRLSTYAAGETPAEVKGEQTAKSSQNGHSAVTFPLGTAWLLQYYVTE